MSLLNMYINHTDEYCYGRLFIRSKYNYIKPNEKSYGIFEMDGTGDS